MRMLFPKLGHSQLGEVLDAPGWNLFNKARKTLSAGVEFAWTMSRGRKFHDFRWAWISLKRKLPYRCWRLTWNFALAGFLRGLKPQKYGYHYFSFMLPHDPLRLMFLRPCQDREERTMEKKSSHTREWACGPMFPENWNGGRVCLEFSWLFFLNLCLIDGFHFLPCEPLVQKRATSCHEPNGRKGDHTWSPEYKKSEIRRLTSWKQEKRYRSLDSSFEKKVSKGLLRRPGFTFHWSICASRLINRLYATRKKSSP
jgi:hypothetical protein